MNAKARILTLALIVAMAVPAAWAQGAPAAVIEYSSGDDVLVIRAGRKVGVADPIGLELYEGDQVQTGKGVFVEMRLASGGAVVKLAENTTFVLERLSDGQTSLQLVYGRVRAKVERLAGTDTFSMRSSQAIAGVRGTDFGIDVVASAGAAATTRTNAYCFEGAVEVTAFIRSDAHAAESLEAIPRSFVVAAGEMLSVEGDSGKAEATKTALDEAIRGFWVEYDYVTEPEALLAAAAPAEAAAAVEPAAAPDQGAATARDAYDRGYLQGFEEARARFDRAFDPVAEGFLSREEEAAIRRASRIQSGGVIAGGLILAGGAALAVNGIMLIDSGDLEGGADALRTGAIISATAIPFLALSLLSRP